MGNIFDNKLNGLKKSKILSIYNDDNIKKAILDKTNLVRKKVMAKIPGTNIERPVYRWVNKETGFAEELDHDKYQHESIFLGTTDEEKLKYILEGGMTLIDKVRSLISSGYYNDKDISEITGGKYNSGIIKKHLVEFGIDPKMFQYEQSETNEMLPDTNDVDDNSITDSLIGMSISEIEERFGSAAAFKRQKDLKNDLIKKFGLSVEGKWENYEDDLEALLDNELGLKAVLAYGTGGVGKSFTLEKVFGIHNNEEYESKHKMVEYDPELDMELGGDEYDYVKIGGKIGSREIQRYLYKHNNKIIVFDDCDSMWSDEGLINVLKNTLDTSGRGMVQWSMPLKGNPEKGEPDIPANYQFSGKMIFITNLSKQELGKRGAAPIVESRAASTDLSMNRDQTIEHLGKIVKKMKLKDTSNGEPLADVTESDKNIAFEVFKEASEYGRLDQLNTRVLSGIIATVRKSRRDGNSVEKQRRKALEKVLIQFGY